MKIGFIGFGKLGQAIITRLISTNKTKQKINLWNRNQNKYQNINANINENPRKLAEKTDVIFICLFDSIAVNNVFTMPYGLLSANLKNKIIIDLTTNHYNTVNDFHNYCKENQAHYLEAPVLGSVTPALKGMLTILVSGNIKPYKKIKPYLEKIASNIFFLEKPNLASKMKLINNLVLGNFMASLAEALSLGEKIGINKDKILDILDKGAGKSLVLDAKKDKLSKENFDAHFSNALIYKDLKCLYDLAYELQNPIFTASATKELFAKTCQTNMSTLDFSSVYKVF